MKGVNRAAVVAGIVITALGHPPGAMGQGTEAFELSGGDVAVYNLAGEVRIVRSNGSAVVVRVTRGGADARELEIAVSEIGGRETLRVIYPSQRVVYSALGRGSNNAVQVRSDGTFYDGRGGDRVEIRGSGRGLEAHADLEIEVPAGREFALYLAVGSTDVRGVVGDLLIDTGSGSVVAENLQGSLRIDTGSGRVSVRSVEGDVSVDTGSGGVKIEDVRGRKISVRTGSGRIDLERVDSDDILLHTGSGSVRLQLLSDVTDLDIDTGSGSVTVWLPEVVGAEVDIKTGSGSIEVDFPVQIRRYSRDRFEGSLGDGEGRIRIDTGSGGVRLARR